MSVYENAQVRESVRLGVVGVGLLKAIRSDIQAAKHKDKAVENKSAREPHQTKMHTADKRAAASAGGTCALRSAEMMGSITHNAVCR